MATNLYTHYISIDFGTSGCAIAVGFSNPEPKKIFLFSSESGVYIKYPTVLLVDPHGAFVSFGQKAFDAFNNLEGQLSSSRLLFILQV